MSPEQPDETTSEPVLVYPSSDALDAAAAAVKDAVSAEEIRFGNFNSRAISLISASSLITALVGVFARDFLSDTYAAIRPCEAILILGTITSLLVAVLILVIQVLLPKSRSTFGENDVTRGERAITLADVRKTQWNEYRQVLSLLAARNAGKARGLHSAYVLYGVAAVFATLTVGIVAIFAFNPGVGG